MKTIKLFAGILAIGAICACGNTKQESKNPAQATENAVEETKSEGAVFYDLTIEEALEKAKTEDKYVLVDFYTSSCAPCKKMEKEVFSNLECGEYVNKHFIPIMIDSDDDGKGAEIAKEYQVFIYPTYMILSPSGFKEGEIIGAEYDINKFLDMLKEIIHDK